MVKIEVRETFRISDGTISTRVYNPVDDYSLHRQYGPAYIEWYIDGSLKKEWFNDGMRHRVNGPAIQRWRDDGTLSIEEWYLYDLRHREDGPAWVYWYGDGPLSLEEWYHHGMRLREDGPAIKWEHTTRAISDVWY